jgi:hypothetical protein
MSWQWLHLRPIDRAFAKENMEISNKQKHIKNGNSNNDGTTDNYVEP